MTARYNQHTADDDIRAAHALKAEGKTIAEISGALGTSPRTENRLLAAEVEPPVLLPRTGKAQLQLSICDKKIATVSGKHFGQKAGHTAQDYFDITIYELAPNGDTPKYCVAISYFKSLREVNSEHHSAYLTDIPASILTAFNPLSVVIGFPDPEQFAAGQKRLEDDIQRQYHALVSQALTAFPEDTAHAQIAYREGQLLDTFAHMCHIVRKYWRFT